MKTEGFSAVSDAHAKVLILGSMPGQRSLAEMQYYAHPRNAFWPIMGSLFNAGPEISYAHRLDRLREHHIALWDVLQFC
ncbi:MAG: TDG/mug DNA glycosylase family protein, partial [Gammaproteobacteria bacterium]